jgi:hypothetical protein
LADVFKTSAFANLQRFNRRSAELERCELCGNVLYREHPHLIDPLSRKLACSCEACAILFTNEKLKYRRIPRQFKFLQDFQLSDAQWDELLVPINMAFFFYSSAFGEAKEKVVALYPSPAGPTESLLSLEAWEELTALNPLLKKMEADVEALLVNRIGKDRGTEAEYYIAPIDECFKLTGLIRANWRGLSGGTEVWEEIGNFFAGLKKRSTIVRETACA